LDIHYVSSLVTDLDSISDFKRSSQETIRPTSDAGHYISQGDCQPSRKKAKEGTDVSQSTKPNLAY
jgi:hypothetical protein